MGDETLRTIAQELVETVRRNATIDWTVRESVRAGMRNAVRRVLRSTDTRRTSRTRPLRR